MKLPHLFGILQQSCYLKHQLFSFGHHCTRARTAEYVLWLYFFTMMLDIPLINKTKTITKALGGGTGDESVTLCGVQFPTTYTFERNVSLGTIRSGQSTARSSPTCCRATSAISSKSEVLLRWTFGKEIKEISIQSASMCLQMLANHKVVHIRTRAQLWTLKKM